jgi:glycosyltransferase involved in cell wall biosynthesis
MRICLDIRPLLEPKRSGVAYYTANLLGALLARPALAGREYVLFLNSANRSRPEPLPDAPASVARSYHHLPNRLLNLSFALAGRPPIEELCGGADAVYLPNLNFCATRRPLIVTVHDLSFVHFPKFFSAKQRLWHAAVRPARLLHQAAAVVAVSEHTKTDVSRAYGIPPEKITVINPAAGPEYRPADAQIMASMRNKYGLPENFFLFLGTLEPRKNIGSVIAALERLPADAHLVIAGGRGWLYRQIFRRAEVSSAAARVHFLDYVADADKPALYSAALALVYPSFYEGFGMPPLEAMACGTPAIVSLASSLGEVVGDAGLLVNPDDVGEIASAMKSIMNEPRLRQELSTAGRQRAARFTWAESARRLDALFATLT